VRSAWSPALLGAQVTEPTVPKGTRGSVPALFGVPGAEPPSTRTGTRGSVQHSSGCQGRSPEHLNGWEGFGPQRSNGVPGKEPGTPQRVGRVRSPAPIECQGRTRSTHKRVRKGSVSNAPRDGVSRARPSLRVERTWHQRLIGCTGHVLATPSGDAGTGSARTNGHRRHGPAHRNSLCNGPGSSCPSGHTGPESSRPSGWMPTGTT
jgi:hypothetical protein